ncbi:YqzE family protein [Alteribacillus persepolensis]|uniref:YqzE family protein n=1 Tax=Alteribacillus persepolensis TaxID=568899 RepID=UPI001587DD90
MEPNPFVKYITQQIVEALDNRFKRPSKHTRSHKHGNFSTRWFGMLPHSLRITWRKMKKIRS